jgi:hypothetical protein
MPVVTVGWTSERYQGRNLALKLVALGYTEVYWYRGGREAWAAVGLRQSEIALEEWLSDKGATDVDASARHPAHHRHDPQDCKNTGDRRLARGYAAPLPRVAGSAAAVALETAPRACAFFSADRKRGSAVSACDVSPLPPHFDLDR